MKRFLKMAVVPAVLLAAMALGTRQAEAQHCGPGYGYGGYRGYGGYPGYGYGGGYGGGCGYGGGYGGVSVYRPSFPSPWVSGYPGYGYGRPSVPYYRPGWNISFGF